MTMPILGRGQLLVEFILEISDISRLRLHFMAPIYCLAYKTDPGQTQQNICLIGCA